MNKYKKIIFAALSMVVLFIAVGCSQNKSQSSDNSASIGTSASKTETTEVAIDNDDDSINWDELPTTEVAIDNKSLNITEAGTYILSGSTTSGITVNSSGNVRIILNGVTIESSDSAAIYVESAENTVIKLAEGTENVIADAATRVNESIDGAIYSKDDLIFTGSGKLTLTSHFQDAIVSKDDLKIISGTYNITSADDAIRGKDSVNILGGTFIINATEDAIKSTNDSDQSKGFVNISGGTFTINCGDDAIHAEEQLIIDGGIINIESCVEGLEAALVTINNGEITIASSDDGINGSASNFTSPIVTINGGTITISATSSFDYDGTATYNGGTIIINGEQVNSIPENTMGGPGDGGFGMG